MITRAQAEALLTLAESLEACERVGLPLHAYTVQASPVSFANRVQVQIGSRCEVTGAALRNAVADLMPKHTGS